MKLGALVDTRFITAFNQLMEQDVSAKAAWNISKMSKQINEHIKEYEASRQKLLKKYGTLNEDGSYVLDSANNVVFKDGQGDLFQKELLELQDVDAVVHKIKVDDIEDAKLSAISIEFLAPVLEHLASV